MIKAVLFDFDGVLIDACDAHFEALNKALEKVSGCSISIEDHNNKYNGLSTRKKLDMLRAEGLISSLDIESIWEYKQQFTEEWLHGLKIDPVKVTLMQGLKDRNIKVGCVSNAIHKTIKIGLQRIGVWDYMDCIVSNEEARGKPDPEGYHYAMWIVKSLQKNTLIIEDSPIGIQAAEASGANVLKVKNAKEVTLDRVLSEINKYA
jgi:HAD superfamily hydrolase (TIGR01509 family)